MITPESTTTATAALKTARRTRIGGNWFSAYQSKQTLEIALGTRDVLFGGVTGALVVDEPFQGEMRINYIEVTDKYRGQKLGKRMLQAFAAEAKRVGANTLTGNIISEEEVHNRLQTFGEDNVTFFETQPSPNGSGLVEVELPMSRNQAIQSLHQAQITDGDATISARTDLTQIDTSQWELPVIKDISRQPHLGDRLSAVKS